MARSFRDLAVGPVTRTFERGLEFGRAFVKDAREESFRELQKAQLLQAMKQRREQASPEFAEALGRMLDPDQELDPADLAKAVQAGAGEGVIESRRQMLRFRQDMKTFEHRAALAEMAQQVAEVNLETAQARLGVAEAGREKAEVSLQEEREQFGKAIPVETVNILRSAQNLPPLVAPPGTLFPISSVNKGLGETPGTVMNSLERSRLRKHLKETVLSIGSPEHTKAVSGKGGGKSGKRPKSAESQHLLDIIAEEVENLVIDEKTNTAQLGNLNEIIRNAAIGRGFATEQSAAGLEELEEAPGAPATAPAPEPPGKAGAPAPSDVDAFKSRLLDALGMRTQERDSTVEEAVTRRREAILAGKEKPGRGRSSFETMILKDLESQGVKPNARLRGEVRDMANQVDDLLIQNLIARSRQALGDDAPSDKIRRDVLSGLQSIGVKPSRDIGKRIDALLGE